MASLNVTFVNPDSLEDFRAKLKDAVNKGIAEGLDNYMAKVLDDTAVGESPIEGGSSLFGYTEWYERYKADVLGVPSSPVNLRVSGSIENYEIDVDDVSSVGMLYFNPSSQSYSGESTGEVMFMHQNGIGVPERKIFPSTVSELPQEIKEDIINKIKEVMNA